MLHQLNPDLFHSTVAMLDAHSGAITALATVLIAGFTWLLWRVNRETTALGKRQAEVAEQQADIMGKQFAIQSIQTDISEKQKEISQIEFLEAHRPKLVLKDVYFSNAENFDQLTIELANVGGGVAAIDGGFTVLEFVSELRDFKHQPGRTLYEPLANNGFTAGSLRSFGIDVPEDIRQKVEFLRENPELSSRRAERIYGDPALVPKGDLYFFGIIYYFDSRGSESDRRASVFRRKWDPVSGNFERTGNPDHEYAD